MNYKLFFIVFLFTVSVFADDKKVNIGVLYEKIFTTKKEAQIGAKIWLKYMEKKPYFEGVNVILYEDEKLIIDDYINNKIGGMISNLTLYFKNKNDLDKASRRRWIPSTTKEIYEQYYLIKHKDSSVTLDNLEQKSVFYKNDIGKVWLESVILKKYKKPLEKVFKKVLEIKKPQQLIFNVFFNKNELSVIPKKLYDSMLELNPQIRQKIKIISKSEPIFFSGIGFTHNKLDEKYFLMLDEMTNDINSSENGLELISLIDLVRVKVVNNKDFEDLTIFYEEYFRLKELYGKKEQK
ncbi:PhnD/SsuA/transferrin family substrate-binding protein [Arcobacter sp. LA11]|uniref:PhnD/SsuA/transferrin family substrate-binding protein n=1 Tax=Arcobacter sp. LA11 TaxID=1898176 RepID=UPI0009323CC8|nr:PhnD/SsuA/transferrin family substrate-binding protein [Arcobacter sp. LA11]